MSIGNTFSSLGSSLVSAAYSFGSACKGLGSSVVETGKMGCNKTVELVRNNPKTTLVTTVALAAVAVGAAYYYTEGLILGAPEAPANSANPS